MVTKLGWFFPVVMILLGLALRAPAEEDFIGMLGELLYALGLIIAGVEIYRHSGPRAKQMKPKP